MEVNYCYYERIESQTLLRSCVEIAIKSSIEQGEKDRLGNTQAGTQGRMIRSIFRSSEIGTAGSKRGARRAKIKPDTGNTSDLFRRVYLQMLCYPRNRFYITRLFWDVYSYPPHKELRNCRNCELLLELRPARYIQGSSRPDINRVSHRHLLCIPLQAY